MENEQKIDASSELEISEPGDCIGHWEDCTECSICEIAESCLEMTKNINGDDDGQEEG